MPSPRTHSTVCGQVVTDLEGRRYTLARLIGQGGQGDVFEVKEGRLAVKILRSLSESDRQRLRRCIQAVKRLDLVGLPIASPIAVLGPPHVGYLMQLAAGMSSLRGMMLPPADGRSVTAWFVATGGLRARLQRLVSIFEVFTRLHGRGLVYGDPSPQNILFTPEENNSRAFLIDADNLHVQRDVTASGVYTPGYGAPELIRGDTGPDTLTDAFALAVIAFELLTLIHPFVGDLVHDGEPELEEVAFRGELPWIEHATDFKNHSSRGIDRDMVISPEVKKLFKRMFEEGLNDRLARPGLGEWVSALSQAADVTITCPHCQASYYAPQRRECPWCGHTRPDLTLAVFYLWDPEITFATGAPSGGFVKTATGQKRPLATMVLAAKDPVQILRRHIHSDALSDLTEHTLVETTRTRTDAVRLHNQSREPLLLIKYSGADKVIDTLAVGAEKLVPISQQGPHWHLHFGPLDRLHRVVVFKPMP
jgi:DNA-binding helix-hairpin-helix protein with protein kinase domain